MTSIAEWLASIGLGEYAQRFAENAIDLSVVCELTEQDLKDLGVVLGHRRKILRAIAEFKEVERKNAHLPSELAPRDKAERRQLTVMFCDLVGSTALSARLDPEDMRQVIGAYHARIGEVISRYNGIVARYMGDGVLVYFGYPQAYEDDAEQAAHAGLALVDAVANLQTKNAVALKVRVGVATGMVVVGDLLIGKDAGERAVVGDTPNLAARLQALAEPGAVLICANTRRLTGGHFSYRDLGPVAAKGWAEPIQAWQLLAASGVESRFDAQHDTRLPPLLGREEEIDLLLRRWRHAAQGEGRVALLTGEPGIGKSRIALALDEQLRAEPHVSARCFCWAHHVNSVLFPFINQLERSAGFERGDAPAQKLVKLEALLAQSTTHADNELALLSDLLSLPSDERIRLPELSPQKRKEMTFAALLAQFKSMTAQRPVLMIIEDVHWIDPTSLELLALMVERVPQLPILLLITARPDFTSPWPGYAHVATVTLTRLSRRDAAVLIERIAGGKTLPDDVTDQILARTDGIPLFVEELTKTVLESGMLQERQDHYLLSHPLPSLVIPTTLHASLMARLDRLASAREVAQIGAVVGRVFSYELLNAFAGLPKERLDNALGQLVQSELVFRRGEIPQAVYTFKHTLVRDAAYSGLLKSRRAELHAAIANSLEQQFPEIAAAQPETLAHHFTEAGIIEKAVGYWLKAGKIAALRSANIEAIAHLQGGIEIVARLADTSERDRLELDLQFALAPCLIATEGPASSRALATFARARELCVHIGDPPEFLQVMFWLVTASVVRGQLPQAHEAIITLMQLAEARGDQPALLNAMRGQGMIHLFMGQLADAQTVIERAVSAFSASDEVNRQAARAAGQDAGVANLALLSWVLWVLGHVDEAIIRIDAALHRADMLQHPHTQAYACYYASILHALRGEPAIAHDCATRCLAISEEHGFRHWLGLSRAVRSICATEPDRTPGVFEEVMAAVDDYHRRGYQLGVTALYVLLCPVLFLGNQSGAALEAINQGLSIVNGNTERIFEAELYRLKASTLAPGDGLDRTGDRKSLLSQALATARSQKARSFELRAARDLAALCIGQGRHDEAFQVLAPVYASFKEGFNTKDVKEAKALLDQLR